MGDFQLTVGERITSTMVRLSPAERRVARKLLSDYPVSGLNTVASLAEAAGVSGPTVFRFVKAIGFSSFRDFQSALLGEVGHRLESNLSQTVLNPPDGAEEPGSILQNAREAHIRGIEHTYSLLRELDVEHVVTLLADPKRRILTFGGTYSFLLAEYLVLQLVPMRAGVTALPINVVAAAAALEDLTRKDVVVVFDFRRYDLPSQIRARSAHERGARVVLVTDRWLSPITDSADHVLIVDVAASGPSDTMVPALALVEALCSLVTSEIGRPGRERLERIDPIRVAL